MANIPQETLLSPRTSVNDVQEDDSDSTKTSKDAGDDATNDDSLHHVLFTSFHDGLPTLVSHHQCRSNQLRQTGREDLFSSPPVSGIKRKWNQTLEEQLRRQS